MKNFALAAILAFLDGNIEVLLDHSSCMED
jgi:hypothetical protein